MAKPKIKLNKTTVNDFKKAYRNSTRKDAQEYLSKKYNVSTRTIREYAKNLGISNPIIDAKNNKILVYDLETSRVEVNVWDTGKQYVNFKSLRPESYTKIISVSWKFIGESTVHSLTWDKNKEDKKLLEKFLKIYNTATMVIGQNNNYFDNKLVKTRAAYYGLFVDNYVKSFDIYKHAKSNFRLHSYSMKYMANYFGLTPKLEHEGILMWEKIEYGNREEQKEYLKKMCDYNIGDIITTEELYFRLMPYFKNITHLGVKKGAERFSSPFTGSLNIKFIKRTWTAAGTVQVIMLCLDTNAQYKINNKTYMDYLQYKMYNNV